MLKACARIQAAAERGDTKSVYEGIRKAVGPTKKLTSPYCQKLGEILHSRNEHLGRSVQHFSLLCIQHKIMLLTVHLAVWIVYQRCMTWIVK